MLQDKIKTDKSAMFAGIEKANIGGVRDRKMKAGLAKYLITGIKNKQGVHFGAEINMASGRGVILDERHVSVVVDIGFGEEIYDVGEIAFGHSVFHQLDHQGIVAIPVKLVS